MLRRLEDKSDDWISASGVVSNDSCDMLPKRRLGVSQILAAASKNVDGSLDFLEHDTDVLLDAEARKQLSDIAARFSENEEKCGKGKEEFLRMEEDISKFSALLTALQLPPSHPASQLLTEHRIATSCRSVHHHFDHFRLIDGAVVRPSFLSILRGTLLQLQLALGWSVFMWTTLKAMTKSLLGSFFFCDFV